METANYIAVSVLLLMKDLTAYIDSRLNPFGRKISSIKGTSNKIRVVAILVQGRVGYNLHKNFDITNAMSSSRADPMPGLNILQG